MCCSCRDIAMGSYDACVPLRPPFPVRGGVVGIDRCLRSEITELWRLGVITHNSCCGHNLVTGSIVVHKDSISKMRALGYRAIEHGRPEIFYARYAPPSAFGRGT